MASTRATTPAVLDSAQLDLPLPVSTLIGLIVGVIAVALITLLTYRALQSRQAAVDRVANTLEAIQQLENVLSSLKDAETAQRGYLLTGDERYAEPFAIGQTAVPNEFAALKRPPPKGAAGERRGRSSGWPWPSPARRDDGDATRRRRAARYAVVQRPRQGRDDKSARRRRHGTQRARLPCARTSRQRSRSPPAVWGDQRSWFC